MDEKILFKAAAILVPAAVAAFLDFLAAVVALALIIGVLLYTRNVDKKYAVFSIVLLVIFIQLFAVYYIPALGVARGHGTVLSDNWFNALNWIRDNTEECSVVATYWDPGHFITGIARRSVVFDGASQSTLYTRPYEHGENGVVVENFDNNINHIIMYQDGNKTTARIQDISTTLLTSNETLAVEILSEYRNQGCDDLYYIASADLIPKSTWWTYFATWNPVDKTGTPYVYSTIPLGSTRPDVGQNAIVYSYPLSAQQAFVVYVTEDNVVVFLQQQGADPARVERFVFFDQNGNGRLITQDDAELPGTAYIQPGNSAILFMPPELENSIFTRMFLFDGQGLEKFEFVNNWGGEVKLFKVNFDDVN